LPALAKRLWPLWILEHYPIQILYLPNFEFHFVNKYVVVFIINLKYLKEILEIKLLYYNAIDSISLIFR
jgi:hypothetical protein